MLRSGGGVGTPFLPTENMEIVSAGRPGPSRDHIRDLFPLYLEELSAYGRVRPHLIKWVKSADDPLLMWFEHDLIECLAIENQGRGAGFAFVARNPFPSVSPDADFRMAEFYIAETFRRQGLGRRALEAIFSDRPGFWELAVADRNQVGFSFWRQVVFEASDSAPIMTSADGQYHFRFHISKAGSGRGRYLLVTS